MNICHKSKQRLPGDQLAKNEKATIFCPIGCSFVLDLAKQYRIIRSYNHSEGELSYKQESNSFKFFFFFSFYKKT